MLENPKEPILIVGAGWAGLSAAVSLTKAGFRVTLLEAAPQAGGRARAISFVDEKVDNGQHLLMGAYQKTLELLEMVGIAEQDVLHRMPFDYYCIDILKPTDPIRVKLKSTGNIFGRLMPFFTMKGFSFNERLKIGRVLYAGFKQNFLKPLADQSVYDFLIEQRQPVSLIEKFWNPLTLAALTTPIQHASTALFLQVLKETFTGNFKNTHWLIPKTDLSELLPNAAIRYLQAEKNDILYHQRVIKLIVESGECRGVVTAEKTFETKNVILATPPQMTAALLQTVPVSKEKTERLIQHLSQFEYQSITTIYLNYDRPVALPYPMIGLIHATAHWLFDRTVTKQPNMLSVVISGDGPHRVLASKTLVDTVLSEITPLFPQLALPIDYRVIVEKKAAFKASVGINAIRPSVASPIAGLYLAGDYTQTHYPATLEGAAKSGFKAAQSILLNKLLVVFCFVVSSLLMPVFADETGFPDVDAAPQSSFNQRSEQIMGDMIMQNIYGSEFMVADPVVNEYLQSLANRFVSTAHLSQRNLNFFGVNTPELNAFAFFGEHVAVHSGLILAVDNENELAAVLAHETAHITQRHLARMLELNRRMMPLTAAELLAAVALGSFGSPEAGFHLATAALAGHLQQMIHFTREHEKEADRVGIALLVKAHFDPRAMASVFEKMRQHSHYDNMPPEYLLTHPIFDSRIADAENRAAFFAPHFVPDSLEFHLVRAHLEVAKPENMNKKIRRLQEKILKTTGNARTSAEYAYALALSYHLKAAEAIPLIKNLMIASPEEWILQYGLIVAEQNAGKATDALNNNEKLFKKYPHNKAILLQQAELFLKVNQPNKAIRLLLPYRKSEKDPALQQLLARGFGALKQPAELHRSKAEWHLRRGEFKEAFIQLELALEYSENNTILEDQIGGRKEAMKAIQREQQELK
jgi:squalene-associated FAD-dependent desaturase